MEMVLNKEFNGIELYFAEKPCKEILEILKGNKWRWHSIKKCWFAKNNPDNMEIAEKINGGEFTDIKVAEKSKEKINDLGIKVGDIFYMSWGYEQTNVDFFRVKELKGKTQVVLQEVYLKVKEESAYSGMSADRKYDGQEYSIVENSCFVEDNEKGMIKKVLGTKENPYINMASYANAYLYHGEKLYESWYY